ncbi:hypothetical protein A3Q56_04022 [Intoshia linei]|uniref:Uncharacterized protein n=1 Tax=Intoshia linei TaxID=1819745 RepID=A0A177B3C1_9BILA|nr:hypothetical protein A3Q56_04022 [Intoshia linei]
MKNIFHFLPVSCIYALLMVISAKNTDHVTKEDNIGLKFDKYKFLKVIMFVHNAERTSQFSLDGDEKIWPQGLKELTKQGEIQSYAFGKFVRNRYVNENFIAGIYNPIRVKIRSVDMNACLATANLINVALFKSSVTNLWDSKLWKPIPVTTLNDDYDYYLNPGACHKLIEHMADLEQSPVLKKYEDEYPELFKLVSDKMKQPIDMESIAIIGDNLRSKHYGDIKYPSWANQKYKNSTYGQMIIRLHEIKETFGFKDKEITNFMSNISNYNPFKENLSEDHFGANVFLSMQKVFSPLVSDIAVYIVNDQCYLMHKIKDQFESFTNGTSNVVMTINVARMVSLLVQMEILNVGTDGMPGFTDALIYELVEENILEDNKKGEKFIRLYYRKTVNEDSQLILQKIEGCEKLCPLNTFYKILNKHTKLDDTDVQLHCKSKDDENDIFQILSVILASILGLSILVFFGLIVVTFMRKKREMTNDNEENENELNKDENDDIKE